jgi:hypothetical protein
MRTSPSSATTVVVSANSMPRLPRDFMMMDPGLSSASAITAFNANAIAAFIDGGCVVVIMMMMRIGAPV